MISGDLDPELENVIRKATPEFTSSLKRRFTNSGINEQFRGTETTKSTIRLEDTYFEEDGNQVILKNLVINQLPIPRLTQVSPNLSEKHFKLDVDWQNVTVQGCFEMTNSGQLQLLPVHSTGKIDITIEKINASGLVGFEIYRDAMKTSNFDIKFTSENVNIQTEYSEHGNAASTRSFIKKKNIDKSLVKHIKRDLYWQLHKSLRTRLDLVLIDFSLSELFHEDSRTAFKYTERSSNTNSLINRMVDKFLDNAREMIIAKGLSNYSVPDFRTDFSHTFGIVSFWGTFEARNGYVSDLSLLERTGDFSFVSIPETDDFEVWGSLRIPDLQLYYGYYYANIWNIGPWGDLHARVGANSFDIKLNLRIKSFLKMDFSITDYDLKVSQLEGTKVTATGLTVLLNWLLSSMATFVTGILKENIVNILEEQLKGVVGELLYQKH